MNVLSIDTATKTTAVAVMAEDEIIGSFHINQKRTHSESLMPMVKELLHFCGMKPEEIDLYVVGKGPGSFTGLRIGMTAAKTMAQVLNKEIIGISTLQSCCVPFMTDKKMIPLLDARGGRVYYGIYQKTGGRIRCLAPDELIELEDLLAGLKGDDYIFIGECADMYRSRLEKYGVVAPQATYRSAGVNLCILGKSEFEIRGGDDVFRLKPEYIRKSQAQRDLDKKRRENNGRDS